MADPRQTARAWLAERLFQRCPGCTFDDTAPSGMAHVRRVEAEYQADAILSAPGVEVDQFAVLDGATLNLKGKRVRLTLPVMTFEPGDEKWLFEPPMAIGETT